jgi:hypothetical protein
MEIQAGLNEPPVVRRSENQVITPVEISTVIARRVYVVFVDLYNTPLVHALSVNNSFNSTFKSINKVVLL